MNYAAIDYSITSPAICTCSGKTFSFDKCKFYSLSERIIAPFESNGQFNFLTHGSWYCNEERYDKISNWALECVNDCMVAIEGYSFGSTGRAVFNIGENGGLLKHKLWVKHIPIRLVPPQTIKKFATGKGTATKEKMYEAWLQDTELDIKEIIQPKRKLGSPTTDIVDAYFICKWIMDQYK